MLVIFGYPFVLMSQILIVLSNEPVITSLPTLLKLIVIISAWCPSNVFNSCPASIVISILIGIVRM